MNKTYQIEGMHCGSCVKKVTAALNGLADSVTVTLDPPRAVLGGSAAELDVLNSAITKAGNYRLTPIPEVAAALPSRQDEENKSWLKTYYPLLLIVGLIAFASFKGAETANEWMLHFMAGFFIVFGFFKLLDLNGFRDAYAAYDLLAKRWNTYGLIYPFLELGLGFMFLFQYQLMAALWFSIVLMGFSSLGVIKALSEKRKIKCACLGTVLKLPMSTITLAEDLGMALMAVIMLIS